MKIIRLGLLVFIMVLIIAPQAQAYTGMTATELRSEISRLTRVADSIRAQLLLYGDAGNTIATPAARAICMQANVQMQRGRRGGSVSTLQQFLVQQGVYSANLVTGYYGPATETGVKRWQASHNIVSYGSPESTGYGKVGPATLRAMRVGCSGAGYANYSTSYMAPTHSYVPTTQPTGQTSQKVSIERYSLSANPTRGTSPLAVSVSFQINGSTCTSYVLDWGDGSLPISYNSNKSSGCIAQPIKIERTHIYNTPGTYSIKFKNGKAPITNIEEVNSITIEVL